MNQSLVIALISTVGSAFAALIAYFGLKRTAIETNTANQRDEGIAADRVGIEGLRELAEQNRQDREEMRAERMEMRRRMDALEDELDTLKRHVADLENENAKAQRELAEAHTLTTALMRYIRRLREFIAGLGHVPPEPDTPLPLDGQ